MAETRAYQGKCHCGAVSFEATSDLAFVSDCNCSICEMKGLNFTFVPAEKFVLRAGESDLTEYRFNKQKIGHAFCRICGVQTFGRGEKPDGTAMVAVNVRCLDGVDWKSLEKTAIDGRSA